MQGRMAALLDIPSPLEYGTTGNWSQQAFEVIGRVQMDRADAASAPWQEYLLWFPVSDHNTWVAYAQGRWYATSEVASPGTLPPYGSLRPGAQVHLGQFGSFVVAEVSQRRVVAGQGSMPNVPKPSVVTYYADISGPGGQFGTIDYGDGSGAPVLFMGKQFDPAEIQLAGGMPLQAPEAEVKACECPNCGGALPIQSSQTERVVCMYCGTASDLAQGNLQALGPSPKPPIQPYIPIGATGSFRGGEYVVVGFVIRSCFVDGVQYSWREYLLWGGDSLGYKWLMEEDGKWTFVSPLSPGDITDSGNTAMFHGNQYSWKQAVTATVDYVIGEFYWKIAIGERVEATTFSGSDGELSREQSSTEVNYTFVTPIDPAELAAFGVAPPPQASSGFGGADFGMLAGVDEDGEVQLGPVGIGIAIVVLVIFVFVLPESGGSYGGGFGK